MLSLLTCVLAQAGSPPNPSINYGCPTQTAYPWCNVALGLEGRLDALVAVMTIEEKASQLQARSCPPIDRIGVPFFCWGNNAINTYGSAAFPIAPAMAATWNMSAVRRLGQAIGTNTRHKFNNRTSNTSHGYSCPGSIVTWGPTMNIIRDPRWGRIFETISEDPYLTGSYATAWTQGAQVAEGSKYTKSIVTLKHLAAYSVDNYNGPDKPTPAQKGSNRDSFNAIVDPYNFMDTYAPGFKMAVTDGNARGVMCSYNEVNGVPACMSPFLRDLLRTDWNFTGYVSSDTDAISPANNDHHYSTTPLEAVTFGLRDGRCDMESSVGKTNYYATYIAQFVNNNTLDVSYVNQAIRDTFRVRFEAGLFDPMEGQLYPKIASDDAAEQDSAEAERDSIVLLQNNNGFLPLQRAKGKSIAIIGPFGEGGIQIEVDRLNNNNNNNNRVGGGAMETNTQHVAAVVVQGCSKTGSDTSGFQAALAAAKAADVVILAFGGDKSVEHEYQDRSNIALPGVQGDLAKLLLSDDSIAKKSVAVLSNRGALAVETIKAKAQAVLLAWEDAGQDGPLAAAAVDAVFGVFSPAGKLPYTMYAANYVSEISFFEMSMTAGVGRSYKYFKGTPLWPFGWGLGYCTLGLTATFSSPPPSPSPPPLVLSSSSTSSSSMISTVLPLTVHATVTNSANCSVQEGGADEVVQVYFAPKWVPKAGTAPLPFKQLIDFERVFVATGGSSVTSFVVTAEKLMTVDMAGNSSLVSGEYDIVVTNGAANIVTHTIQV